MVLVFDKTLDDALKEIGFSESEGVYLEQVIYDGEVHVRELIPIKRRQITKRVGRSEEVWSRFARYGQASNCLACEHLFDFFNHAYSNIFERSQYGRTYKDHYWFGKRGFVIGIEQKGRGFDAVQIDSKRTKNGHGHGFDHYRSCPYPIFFDNSRDARVIYVQYDLANIFGNINAKRVACVGQGEDSSFLDFLKSEGLQPKSTYVLQLPPDAPAELGLDGKEYNPWLERSAFADDSIDILCAQGDIDKEWGYGFTNECARVVKKGGMLIAGQVPYNMPIKSKGIVHVDITIFEGAQES